MADRPFQKATERLYKTCSRRGVDVYGPDVIRALERMAELVVEATMWPIVPSPKRLAEIAAEVERMLEQERT